MQTNQVFSAIPKIVLAVMFLAFAYLQLNDPDPVVWVIIYSIMAVLSLMAAFSYYPSRFIFSLLIAYAAYSIFFIPGVIEWLQQDDKAELFDDLAKMRNPYIEESREFLGLLICIAVLIYFLLKSRKSRI